MRVLGAGRVEQRSAAAAGAGRRVSAEGNRRVRASRRCDLDARVEQHSVLFSGRRFVEESSLSERFVFLSVKAAMFRRPAALLLFPLSMASAFVVPSNSAASLLSLRSARSLPATALFRTATQPLGTIAKRKSGARACRSAVDGYDSLLSLDSPAAWAAFILWSVPLPVAIGSILRFAESTSGQAERPALDVITKSTDKPLGVQRNLMWCFPSFGCFLKSADRQPPLGMPYWQKWGLFLNSWAGLAWYLNYKIKIEDELKEYNGEGLGGAGTQFPRFTSTNVQTLT